MRIRGGVVGVGVAVVAVVVAACTGSSTADLPSPTAVGSAPANVSTGAADAPAAGAPAAGAPASDVSTPTTIVAAPTTTVAPEPTTTLPAFVTGNSDFLFDQDQLHDFEINLDEAKLAVLDEDPAAEEYVEGALTFNGDEIGTIGVRYKGSIGSFLGCTASGFGGGADGRFNPSGEKTCARLSMKLKINWDDPERKFYGVRRVLLHSAKQDASHLIERAMYWTFGEMGVPAPRATSARVTVNGEFLGIFTLVEQPDKRFAEEHFADGTGNLYKEVWPFNGVGAPQSEELLRDALETNEGGDASVEITRTFAEEVAAAAPGERRAVLERWTDVDTMLRFLVVDRATSNEDGPLHWYCGDVTPRDNDDGEAAFAESGIEGCAPHNFFWYEDPTARKVYLVPWDVDISLTGFAVQFISIPDDLGTISNDCQPFSSGMIPLQQISASCDPMIAELAAMGDEYAAIRAELLSGPLSEAGIDAQIERWAKQIEESITEASAANDELPTPEAFRTAVDQLLAYFADHRAAGGAGR